MLLKGRLKTIVISNWKCTSDSHANIHLILHWNIIEEKNLIYQYIIRVLFFAEKLNVYWILKKYERFTWKLTFIRAFKFSLAAELIRP